MKFWDPSGEIYGIPTFPCKLAPTGLATRRQLRADGLRPGGQDPVAQLMWRRYTEIKVAYLYRTELALPVRPMTPARWRAHEAMMLARRTCPTCGVVRPYVIPRSLGECPLCADAPALAA